MKSSIEKLLKLANKFESKSKEKDSKKNEDIVLKELIQKFNKPVSSLEDLLNKLNSFISLKAHQREPFYSFRARLGKTNFISDNFRSSGSSPAVIVGFNTDSPMYDQLGDGEYGKKYLQAILKAVPSAKIEYVKYSKVIDSSPPGSTPDVYYVYVITL